MLQRVNLIVLLAWIMIATLATVIVFGAIALVLNGAPSGSALAQVADVFAWIFSLAFFAAFALAMSEQRWREKGSRVRLRSGGTCTTRQIQPTQNAP